MLRWLKKADDLLFGVERILIFTLLALMTTAVFMDAVHRIFSAGEGRLERLLVALVPAPLESATRHWIAPVALFLMTLSLFYLALRTVEREGRVLITPSRALLWALGVTLILLGATQLLVHALPNGLIWSQEMALVFMLWVGLLGASIATRQRGHIAFEMVEKLWPRRAQRTVQLISRCVAGGFCFFLSILAFGFVRYHYSEWIDSEGTAGIFEGFPLPRWMAYGFIPFPLLTMAFRFLGYGVAASASLEMTHLDAAHAKGPTASDSNAEREGTAG